MRKKELLVTALVAVAGVGHAQGAAFVNTPRLNVPSPIREFRAAWVATVSNLDWPSSRGVSSAVVTAQRTQMNSILDTVQSMNMNAVLLQVRPSSDALYSSTLEPWSYFLTGRMGAAPQVSGYDPLAEWITAARQRGIAVHAWVNPYRVFTFTPQFTPPPGTGWNDTPSTVSSTSYIPPTHPYREQSGLIRQYLTTSANDYWFDPGDPATRQYVRGVINDIVARYDIDGLVIDDYFYPYPGRDASNNIVPFPDSATFALYGGGQTLANWRRQNVNNLIFELYTDIKAAKPHVLFGVSPFGIWQSGTPAGIVGLSSFSEIYADSRLWFNNGWLDYMSPQLYWSITATQQSYPVLLNWWGQQNTQGRHLWPSNAAYRIVDTSNWLSQEIVDQVNVTRDNPVATGNIFFRMGQLTANSGGLRTNLTAGPYSVPALMPASPWLDNVPPQRPNLTVAQSAGNHVITWSANGSEPARWWNVSLLIGNSWQQRVLPASATTLSLPRSSNNLRAVAVGAVDRLGNVSPRANRVLDASVLLPSFRPN